MLFAVVMCLTDVIANYGKIHSGVSVAGVYVGGMTKEEAAELLERELTARIEASPVDIECEQLTLAKLLDISRWGPAIELDANLHDASGFGADPLVSKSWRIRALTLTASIDGAALAEQAYAVGREGDFFSGRFQAWLHGIDLPGYLTYNEQQLNGLIQLLEQAVGTPLVNADIFFIDSRFIVVPSARGIGIDRELFNASLDKAMLGENRLIDIPLMETQPQILDSEAQELADKCNLVIAEPVMLTTDNGQSWEINAFYLGSWLTSSIVDEGGQARLVVRVSSDYLKRSLSEVLGGYDPGVDPVNAQFSVSSDGVTIIPSEDGLGIDYPQLAIDLERILFGTEAEARQMQLSVATLTPSMSTADAEAMRITTKISTYSTDYGFSTPARAHNVEVASSYVTHSLIPPRTVWSFNETSGDATLERGYQVSKVISGNVYQDAVGGGVCQVATTVFNAVFEAGYPIVNRANHGLYQWQYAAGRDAAVFYDWLDFKWENDTDNWILLTVTCYQGWVTASLWGTPPGYRVETEVGAWIPGESFRTEKTPNDSMYIGEENIIQAGVSGRSINVTRRVFDANGNLLRETTFKSTYSPVTEEIEYGTRQPEIAPDPEPPPDSGTLGDQDGTNG